MPPEWMWPFPEELEVWFEEVERRRQERYGGGSGDSGSTDGMMVNELSQGRR